MGCLLSALVRNNLVGSSCPQLSARCDCSYYHRSWIDYFSFQRLDFLFGGTQHSNSKCLHRQTNVKTYCCIAWPGLLPCESPHYYDLKERLKYYFGINILKIKAPLSERSHLLLDPVSNFTRYDCSPCQIIHFFIASSYVFAKKVIQHFFTIPSPGG